MKNFSPFSRVWIYAADRQLNEKETAQINAAANDFVTQWTSHNNALKAFAMVEHHRFLVLSVDESQAGASGCSIDKSVRFIHQIGEEFGIDFFNRLQFSFFDEAKNMQTVDKKTLQDFFQQGKINEKTIVVDTLVDNLEKFETGFCKPLGESWHRRILK
jgi:hypothetical protein